MDKIYDKWKNILKKINIEEKRKALDQTVHSLSILTPGSQEAINASRDFAYINGIIQKYEELNNLIEELKIYDELSKLDDEYMPEYEDLYDRVAALLSDWEIELLFDGKYDNSNVYLTIHAGSGGTEAQDWAEMLSRMYMRWSNRHGFGCEIVDLLDGDTAGIKSITLLIKGKNVYGQLQGEHGVHRLVRVSPFDAKNRRHTSFAAVEVLPQLPLTEVPQLNWNDIVMQSFRSGGPGGQYQNTTDSGCRLIHQPTGIVVESRQERSQLQNRKTCEEMLAAKLIALEEEKKKAEVDELKGEQTEAGWGHAIRSYVFMPYQLVKDNRSGYETGKVEAVLDGEIDDMIKEYLINVRK